VHWVAESMRPFSIVEDEGFKKLMKTGRPEYYIPSRVTVARDVQHVFRKAKERISNMLQVSSIVEFRACTLTHSAHIQQYVGTLSFGTNTWTSPNNKVYVAVTVHFEQEGVPISLLLDIIEVAKSHSGVNLAAAFAQILEDFKISNKVSIEKLTFEFLLTISAQILSVTCDNATVNDVMIDELADLVEGFPGGPNRTCCFTHVLNLVARSILKQFDIPNKAKEELDEKMTAITVLAGEIELEEAEMDSTQDEEVDDNLNEEGLMNVRAGLTPAEIAELDESVHPVRVVLVKVRQSIILMECSRRFTQSQSSKNLPSLSRTLPL
jgi:hypothetical protein